MTYNLKLFQKRPKLSIRNLKLKVKKIIANFIIQIKLSWFQKQQQKYALPKKCLTIPARAD